MANWIRRRTELLVPGTRHWYLDVLIWSMLSLQNFLQVLFFLLFEQS